MGDGDNANVGDNQVEMNKERPGEEGPGSIDHFSYDRGLFCPRQGNGSTNGKENSMENGHLFRVYSALAYFFSTFFFSESAHRYVV